MGESDIGLSKKEKVAQPCIQTSWQNQETM